MKNRNPPKLDKDVEDEVSKLANMDNQAVEKPVEKLQVDTVVPEVNLVDLPTVIEFERKAKIKTKENEENAEERRDISRTDDGERKTPLPGRTDKGKSKFVY
ncbi:MAG: hypothetical protein KKF54_08115 [Candidatus Omnitrophica bacterium]|nr:hypothetical protein [Candidatus Omnitrophota bacterium]